MDFENIKAYLLFLHIYSILATHLISLLFLKIQQNMFTFIKIVYTLSLFIFI